MLSSNFIFTKYSEFNLTSVKECVQSGYVGQLSLNTSNMTMEEIMLNLRLHGPL